MNAELQGWIANVRFRKRACWLRLNCRKIQEKTGNKKTLKNLKKPLAIPKNYAISNLFETNIYRYLRIAIGFVLGMTILILANLKKKKVGEKN